MLCDSWAKSVKALGADHPQTLIQMGDLGTALSDQNKLDEAAPLVHDLLDALRRVSGPSHPQTLVEQRAYALILKRQGKFAEADLLFRDALEKSRATLGNDHQDTIRTIANLATLLLAEKRFAEAETLYREAMAGYERTRGKDFRGITEVCVRLGETLTGLNRFTEAEAELLAVQQTIEKSPQAFARARQPNLKAITALYETWEAAEPGKGHGTQAGEWKAKRDALIASTQPTTGKSH